MSGEKLLVIEPRELKFSFELYKEAFCTVRLINNSRHHVAFKIMTTNPDRYFGRPSIGVLSPRSTRDVRVTMLGPTEVPPDMHCRDIFSIKSIVANPGITAEGARELFMERWRAIETCRLDVVYVSSNSEQILRD